MESLTYRGSTSDFFRFSSGIIVKSPMRVWAGNPNQQKLEEEMEKAISFEQQVLEKLGDHPRIVPYLGPHSSSRGIKLSEASHGNLQAYIDSGVPIDNSLRWKWSLQAVEAVVYVHHKGVIHSDLRPENYLVHTTKKGSLDLWLCDFGGARCDSVGLNVSHLPDEPFFDPRMPWNSTSAVDIFSLGSMIYTILTGHWPYREGPPPVTVEDKSVYEAYVNGMFTAGRFPDVSWLKGGTVIMKCWNHQYSTAEEVLLQLTALVN